MSHQHSSDKFIILSEDLNRLMEMVQIFSSDTQSKELREEIQELLQEMNALSKPIGGSVLDRINDLQIDVNLYLQEPDNHQFAPKIFQDFQLLKNDLSLL